jgi:hypothetical protein
VVYGTAFYGIIVVPDNRTRGITDEERIQRGAPDTVGQLKKGNWAEALL